MGGESIELEEVGGVDRGPSEGNSNRRRRHGNLLSLHGNPMFERLAYVLARIELGLTFLQIIGYVGLLFVYIFCCIVWSVWFIPYSLSMIGLRQFGAVGVFSGALVYNAGAFLILRRREKQRESAAVAPGGIITKEGREMEKVAKELAKTKHI